MVSIIAMLLSGLFVFVTVMICIIISLENRNPSKTISWLMVLTLLPGIGFVLYLLFGENVRKGRWRKAQEKMTRYIDQEEVKDIFAQEDWRQIRKVLTVESRYFDIAERNIMRLVINSGTTPITLRNKVDIFAEGESKFAQMFEDMRQAQDHIHLEYFIIRDSEIAQKLQEILIQKAKQGVKVRILYDDIGSWRLYFKPQFMHKLRQAGCEVYSFVQTRFPFLLRNLNYRDHRKICVIDGKIGYVGGINIGDEYVHKSKKFGYWRDTHLRLEGPSVYMLQTTFLLGWLMRTDQSIIGKNYYPILEQKGESVIQIALSGADTRQETIYQAYFYAIAQAKETVYIQTPYFIPDEAMQMALKAAILAGVDVRIIFPAVSDHFFVHHASVSYLEELMNIGAKVYFYKKGFIHSKVLLIDRELATVGTANMDIRSFMLNSEINAFIYDNPTVEQLYDMFYADLKDCVDAAGEIPAEKSLHDRLRASFCRLLSPLL